MIYNDTIEDTAYNIHEIRLDNKICNNVRKEIMEPWLLSLVVKIKQLNGLVC